jgi:hypothetical protein
MTTPTEKDRERAAAWARTQSEFFRVPLPSREDQDTFARGIAWERSRISKCLDEWISGVEETGHMVSDRWDETLRMLGDGADGETLAALAEARAERDSLRSQLADAIAEADELRAKLTEDWYAQEVTRARAERDAALERVRELERALAEGVCVGDNAIGADPYHEECRQIYEWATGARALLPKESGDVE